MTDRFFSLALRPNPVPEGVSVEFVRLADSYTTNGFDGIYTDTAWSLGGFYVDATAVGLFGEQGGRGRFDLVWEDDRGVRRWLVDLFVQGRFAEDGTRVFMVEFREVV